MLIIWELSDKSLAVTRMIGNRDVNAEVQKIQQERPELTHKFNTPDLKILSYTADIFFKAVELDESNEPVYNMVKARDIWRDKIRADRYSKFNELDVEFQRALEINDTVKMAEVVAKKQILRDAPNDPAIEAAPTIQELKEIYPEILK